MILDLAGQQRLRTFFDEVGELLGNKERRASFATYAQGLLADGERKSVEPMAARACADPATADAAHQRLLHFIANSRWSDREVRRFAARHALGAMTVTAPVTAWILDDTGFLKQGKHSVGVQRQYTGSAGKITNCQIGVSLAVATEVEQVPIDFELYLPQSWANDPARRAKAAIPDSVQFKTKPQLALEMVRRAVIDEVPRGVVLADTAYGTSSDFRLELRRFGLNYIVGVDPQTKVFELGTPLMRGGAAVSVKELAFKLAETKKFRRTTWREGTKEDLKARFALLRVFPCRELEREQQEKESVWLIIEWRDGEDEPANYFFSSLPKTRKHGPLIRTTMERWKIERTYEDLKGELGLDHYEGRRFPGWHHHVSVALCCYAFVVSERARHFPPSAGRPMANFTQPLAA